MDVEEKKVRLGKYEIGRTLGEGNFGKTHPRPGTHSPAGYESTKRFGLLLQIKREIGTLKLLKHPNIVRLYKVNKRLSEHQGRKVFQQLIDAISYCHNKGVYHMDLKPENILIDAKGIIKVLDFGSSALSQNIRNDRLLHTTCGSPHYIAPEVISNRGYDGAMSGIWSCGVILYLILTGCLPFTDRNIVLYLKILKGQPQFPKWLPLRRKALS